MRYLFLSINANSFDLLRATSSSLSSLQYFVLKRSTPKLRNKGISLENKQDKFTLHMKTYHEASDSLHHEALKRYKHLIRYNGKMEVMHAILRLPPIIKNQSEWPYYNTGCLTCILR
jgi:hypothetical protein